jgi:hypothetical protein
MPNVNAAASTAPSPAKYGTARFIKKLSLLAPLGNFKKKSVYNIFY